jgi:hypothetical protein
VIPFALGPTGAGSSQACIFANPTDVLDVEPCNGPTEGNFGFLDISLYGNDDPLVGTTTKCTGDTQGRLATNIIVGADHEHGKYTLGDTIRNDTTMCPISTALPNEVPTQTGGSATGLDNGLFRGINSPLGEGRLMCKGSLSSTTSGEGQRFPRESESCADILNNLPEELDNTPLWEYLNEDAASETAACANGLVNSRQTMATCLLAWRAFAGTHSTYLFEDEVLESTRFAGVPKLSADPSNGTGNYLILDVIPVYLETLYMGCTANTCALVHSPGETGPSTCPNPLTPLANTCGVPANGNPNLRALTSFILTMDMLSPEVAERWPTRPGTLQFNLLK